MGLKGFSAPRPSTASAAMATSSASLLQLRRSGHCMPVRRAVAPWALLLLVAMLGAKGPSAFLGEPGQNPPLPRLEAAPASLLAFGPASAAWAQDLPAAPPPVKGAKEFNPDSDDAVLYIGLAVASLFVFVVGPGIIAALSTNARSVTQEEEVPEDFR